MDSILKQISETIRSASRVQVLGHLRPDGDCIGSLLGVAHILDHLKIKCALAAAEHMYPGYRMIPGYERIATAPLADLNPDLAIFVDTADRKRAFPDWQAPKNSIVIDHHGSNPQFGMINWIEPERASTGEMIFQLAKAMEIPFNADFANALLLGVMTDTGSLRFSSVRPEHFEICAELVRAGADVTLISKAAYETKPFASVKLGAEVLSAVELRAGDRLAWSEARRPMLEKSGGADKLPENLVNEIRSIEGVRVAILFIEPKQGGLRASFRGDGLLDVATLAGEFGGGGHKNAAGLTIETGAYETLRDEVLKRAESRLTEKS